jgi:hypothetical protein
MKIHAKVRHLGHSRNQSYSHRRVGSPVCFACVRSTPCHARMTMQTTAG